jgi:hypothetical protein
MTCMRPVVCSYDHIERFFQSDVGNQPNRPYLSYCVLNYSLYLIAAKVKEKNLSGVSYLVFFYRIFQCLAYPETHSLVRAGATLYPMRSRDRRLLLSTSVYAICTHISASHSLKFTGYLPRMGPRHTKV